MRTAHAVDLGEAGLRAAPELLVRHLVRRVERGVRRGGDAEEADAVDLDPAPIERDAELDEPRIDLRRVAVARDGEEPRRQRPPALDGALGVVRRPEGRDVAADDEHVDGACPGDRVADRVEAVVDVDDVRDPHDLVQ